ncbi:MAG: hypothetical protein H8K03_19420 [Nitrospira sp.]|nr:hypothetical protein [Nitrospira sp. BO4]
MKSNTKRVCIMSFVAALVITGDAVSARAAEVEPISEGAPVLMVQAPVAPEAPQSSTPLSENARILVGHWRKTTIVFEQPKDEHLVLHADGTLENWIVTASSRSPMTPGVWRSEGKILELLLEGQEHIAQPFTIHEGQLVFPNIPNRRRFWEKIE